MILWMFLCSQAFAAGNIIDRGATSAETTAQKRDDVWLSPASIPYVKAGRSATFVIAASDSLHKDQADYVCDGTNDQTEVKQAVDALPSFGGTIRLLPGNYMFTAGVVVDKPVSILGDQAKITLSPHQEVRTLTANATAGTDSITVDDASSWDVGYEIAVYDDVGFDSRHINHNVIKSIVGNTVTFTKNLSYSVSTADNAIAVNLFNAFTFHVDSHENIEFSGVTFDGNSDNYNGSTGLDEYVWVQCVLLIDAGSPPKDNMYLVENCRFEDITHTAMNVQGSGAVVRNCWFDDVGVYGIDVGDDSPIIRDNRFENCGLAGISYCKNLWATTISGNELEGCKIGVLNIGSDSNDRVPSSIDHKHQIVNNHFYNIKEEAILFSTSPREIIISGNTFHNINTDNNGHYAIKMLYIGSPREINVLNNLFLDDQAVSTTYKEGAISLRTSTETANLNIDNNIFQNWAGDDQSDKGIRVEGDGLSTISSNSFNGLFEFMVWIRSGGRPAIKGNSFQSMDGNITHTNYAVRCDETQSASIIDNRFMGVFSYAIYNNDGNNTLIDSNYIELTEGTGIACTENPKGVTITNNYLKSVKTGGYPGILLYLNGNTTGSDFVITNNQFKSWGDAVRAFNTCVPTDMVFMGNIADNCTEDFDFEGHYPASYRPDIGGADFKADVEQFNIGTVTDS